MILELSYFTAPSIILINIAITTHNIQLLHPCEACI
uniref:Uncharacterized protein n=1 Tax=Arundo donax TaxID=35708 RepID=A0A0A9AXL9_ARUDO